MKNIFKILFFVAVIATIIFGKQYIDKKTFKYEETVNKSITNFFISGNQSDLEPLATLLDSYGNDEEIVYNIQTTSNDEIWSWFAYADGKYKCDRENLNSCKVQLEEFQTLHSRLVSIYAYKTKNNNFPLMLSSSYNNIINEVTKKNEALNKIIASPSAKNPPDSEQTRQKKCAAATNCTSCRDGVCTCTYITDTGKKEDIRCNSTVED